MNLTFSMFGYFFSLQLSKTLFVPIERLDSQGNNTSLILREELPEHELLRPTNCEAQTSSAVT